MLIALALLGGWELYARVGGVESLILPAPTEVARALWEDRSLLWDNFRVTAGGGAARPLPSPMLAGGALAVALHLSGAACGARSTRCSSPPRPSRS